MAIPSGTEPVLLAALHKAPHAFDLFDALRRVECAFPQKMRLGQGLRPGHEPLRLGQEPMLAFASSPLARFVPAQGNKPPRLLVHSLGLLGPSGPLPLHLSEYARDRVRNSGDPTLARFLDVFHHRALSLFYRAWANSRPTVSFDRPAEDRFATTLGALCGQGSKALRGRDQIPDNARLHFAGRLAAHPRNAEGLVAMLRDFFGLPVTIEPLVGEWLPLSPRDRWHLGRTRALGQGTVLGARTWQRQGKFRVVLGPLDEESLRSLLPGGSRLARLRALVNHYVGPALTWDLRLRPNPRKTKPLRMGQGARLGWTAWLGSPGHRRQDVIFDPARTRHQADR
jgi:type VI secretion system protein ImpH